MDKLKREQEAAGQMITMKEHQAALETAQNLVKATYEKSIKEKEAQQEVTVKRLINQIDDLYKQIETADKVKSVS